MSKKLMRVPKNPFAVAAEKTEQFSEGELWYAICEASGDLDVVSEELGCKKEYLIQQICITPSLKKLYDRMDPKNVKRMAPVDEERFYIAIRKCHGNLMGIAKMLDNRSPQTIKKYFNKWPHLLELKHMAEEAINDMAEQNLIEHIEDGDVATSIQWLRSKAADRGWNPKVGITNKDGDGPAQMEVIEHRENLLDKLGLMSEAEEETKKIGPGSDSD